MFMVTLDGMTMLWSQRVSIWPPVPPVNPMVVMDCPRLVEGVDDVL